MELLGAYALDAVDDDERAAIDELLDTDADARAELARFREATDRLAGPDVAPPPGLWEGLAARLGEDGPTALGRESPPVVVDDEHDRDDDTGPVDGPGTGAQDDRSNVTQFPAASPFPGRPGRKPFPTLAAAAAVVVIALVGAAVVLLRDDAAPATIDQLAQSALADGDHEVVDLVVDDRLIAQIAFDASGAGYFVGGELEPLAADRTYQLWGVEGEQVISLGVLGSEPSAFAFHSDGAVDAFVLTDERAGGVGQSEGELVAQVSLA